MKKSVLAITMIVVFVSTLVSAAYGASTPLFDMKAKLMDESKAIKGLIQTSRDAVLVNNMWDSCVVAITQLDAYFYMIGIVGTFKKEPVTPGAIDYMTRWLGGMKKSNSLNIESLKSIDYEVDPATRLHIKTLITYFTEMNSYIDGELDRVAILGRAAASAPAAKK